MDKKGLKAGSWEKKQTRTGKQGVGKGNYSKVELENMYIKNGREDKVGSNKNKKKKMRQVAHN